MAKFDQKLTQIDLKLTQNEQNIGLGWLMIDMKGNLLNQITFF